jgi:hypothetical protein
MCLESDIPRRLLQSHHINRKVDKPQEALDLDNGICLCQRCHMQIVHTTHKHHKRFRVIFWRWNNRKAINNFNEQYQNRLKYKNVE